MIETKNEPMEIPQPKEVENAVSDNHEMPEALAALEQGIHAALETYSNVHRGSGHNSMVTTHLFDQAREIVLEYLGLNKRDNIVVFCTPDRAIRLKSYLDPKSFQSVSSKDIGLLLGVIAITVKWNDLPKGIPFQTGGGTTRLVSRDWVIWADAPEKFEAGTPAIINVIAFAKALRLIGQYGKDVFRNHSTEKLKAAEILYHDELKVFAGQELFDKLRMTLIGRGVQVPTAAGSLPYINLDNSASTPTFGPIWDAFRQTLHQPIEVQQEVVQEVKSICCGFLGAPSDKYDVIFTSNTTEAINLTAECLGRESAEGIEPVVINTLLEHSSNDLPWRMVPGCSIIRLTVNDEGFVDLKALETNLRNYNQENQFGKKRIRIVAISGASNVLGICNNIAEISRIVHQYGARLLVDAAQLTAHRKIEMEANGIDYLAFSAHKVYAPFGSGVLMVRKGLLHFSNAEMELIRFSDEENAAGIAALGKSLVLLQRIGMDLIHENEQALTRRLLQGMVQIDGLRVYGIMDPDSSAFVQKLGVIVFSIKGMAPNRLALELAVRSGIGVRYGCFCAHIIIKHLLNISPFLERVQGLIVKLFHKLSLPGLVRVSLGIENSEEDVDTVIRVLHEISGKPQPTSTTGKIPKLSHAEVKRQMKEFTHAAALRVYS
ncbi:MAG: aminotransferase class V-fold PLP-dependent enzyme [Bacteroidales bacterium]|nr:aminotransferase class V-fold PLP-dependent enzyme [Bacteroidales bacterium]